MSMTKDAIQHIQETATGPVFMGHLDGMVQKPAILVPESMRIEDVEKYMDYASRYRMKYRTTLLADYLTYGKEHGSDSLCLVDPETMSALTIFDVGTPDKPGHKEHVATLSLAKTAAYKSLEKLSSDRLSQKSAAEFIEEWGDYIAVEDSSGEEIPKSSAVATIRDLTIDSARKLNSSVGDFSDSKSLMEKLEMSGSGSLPARILFTCSPYHGLKTRVIRLRVSMLVGGAQPELSFKVLCAEQLNEDICEEFKDLVVAGFEGVSIKTYIGAIDARR
ncbi:MAG: DUF2303 family protein [Anaerolineae bacterium]|nr:DUF2303 family protein [Anaerolineae bacterium]